MLACQPRNVSGYTQTGLNVTAYFAGWWVKDGASNYFKCNLVIHAQYQERSTGNPYSVKQKELMGYDCYNKLDNWESTEYNLDNFGVNFTGMKKDDGFHYEFAIKELRFFPNMVYNVTDKENQRMMEADPVGSRS